MELTHAARLIEDAGGVEKFFETLGKLRKNSQPEGDGNPRKARQKRGTGARTSSIQGGSASAKTNSGD